MKLNELVEKYIQLRDKKAELKKQLDEKTKPIEAAMEQIEAVLLQTFDSIGTDSVKSAGGTAYISTRNSASVADKQAFREFIASNEDHWALADIRAAKTAVEQYVNEKGELPPGVNWSSERVINVRRAA